jgi:hypothetical protein
MPCPFHSSRFYLPNNIGRGVQIFQQVYKYIQFYRRFIP